MTNPAWLDRAGKFYRFLSPKVVAIAAVRTLTGLCLFVAEVALGFCLLVFFERLQGGEATQLKWLPFLTGASFQSFLIFFCGIVLAKGLLEWLDTFLQVLSDQTYRFVQRSRLTEYLFNTRELKQSEYFDLFNQHMDRSYAAWANVQSMLRQCTLILPMLVTLFVIAPLLTLPLILVLAAFSWPFRVTNRAVRGYSRTYFTTVGKLNHRLMMTAKNLLLLRIHGMEDTEKKNMNESLASLKHFGQRFGFVAGTTNTYTYLVGTSLIVVIGFVGKKVSPEVIPLILPYLYILNRMLAQTLAFFGTMPQFHYNYSGLDKLSRWWAEHAHDGVRGRKLYVRSTGTHFGKIEQPIGWKVKNISFRFHETSDPVFNNFTLDIPAGKVSVFVGESGSGKSSLLNLLLGELVPDEGTIDLVHGAQRFPLQDCRHEILPNVGYVGAESFVIPGTLRDNLLYGVTRQVSDAEIMAAAQKAQCMFLFESANSLERLLTDQGEGLSAGQKQRLCLARALLRNPKVLILDEATSNLDEPTEQALVDTLMGLKGQMTMICATHRKGFLRLADEVIELKKQPALKLAKTGSR